MKDVNTDVIAALIGSIIGTLIGTAITSSLFYVILVFLIKVPVTFLQVWGATLIFDMITNAWKNRNNS